MHLQNGTDSCYRWCNDGYFSIMLQSHVCADAQKEQTKPWLKRGPFRSVVATVGEGEMSSI